MPNLFIINALGGFRKCDLEMPATGALDKRYERNPHQTRQARNELRSRKLQAQKRFSDNPSSRPAFLQMSCHRAQASAPSQITGSVLSGKQWQSRVRRSSDHDT